MPLKFIILLGTLFMLSGCAVMNKNECILADWRMIGMEEGIKGHDVSSIGSYRKACVEFGITPSLAAYQAGHIQGIKQFCSPQMAYQLGESGRSLPSVCPDDIHPNFLSQHDRGLRKYCTVGTAYSLGKSGSSYPRICPQELTKKLSFSFNRGKRVYQEIKAYRREVGSLNQALEETEDRVHALEHQHGEHVKKLELAHEVIYSNTTTDKEKVAFYQQRDQSQELIVFIENELAGLYSDKIEQERGIAFINAKISRAEKMTTSYRLD